MVNSTAISRINSAKAVLNIEHNSGDLIQKLFDTKKENEAREILDLLWENMFHQEEIGEVAFFIVPQLVNYMIENKSLEMEILSYCISIEYHRIIQDIEIPKEIKNDYENSFEKLWNKINFFLEKDCDFNMCIAISSLIALKNNQLKLISMLL
ncbi:hypothetical protein WAF17_17140 [Bernardetia sp. ABR2-2B]|uniref:hypothetical protein n=1 Tax=Bernardetia sp. ABR2-2B TaxID=3127472 RepID=UPI0030D48B51